MGRAAYEGMAEALPTADHPFTGIMNAARKVVFSRTLRTAEWANTTIAAGDTAEEIDKLRRGGDGHIVVWGGVSLWRSLMQLDLIDEFPPGLAPLRCGRGYPAVRRRPPVLPARSGLQHRVQQRDRRAALPPAPLNRQPTCTTSGNQASATTCPRGPWPNSNQPAILAASPRSTVASRHRGSTSKRTLPL
jgi:RibD C-terminal domain